MALSRWGGVLRTAYCPCPQATTPPSPRRSWELTDSSSPQPWPWGSSRGRGLPYGCLLMAVSRVGAANRCDNVNHGQQQSTAVAMGVVSREGAGLGLSADGGESLWSSLRLRRRKRYCLLPTASCPFLQPPGTFLGPRCRCRSSGARRPFRTKERADRKTRGLAALDRSAHHETLGANL